jgi:hypothetical protein
MRVWLGGVLLHDAADLDSRRVVAPFDIWDATPSLDVILVPNAGGSGAVAAGEWVEKEKYGTLAGRAAIVTRADYDDFRRTLLTAVAPGAESELVVEDDDGVQRRMFVMRADAITPTWVANRWCAYTVPLVAPDPGKYDVGTVEGLVGVWTGDQWFRQYQLASGKWVRRFAEPATVWERDYQQAVVTGLPVAVQLASPGDDWSDRVSVTVTGPLTQGDWYVLEETTGDKMWAELSLVAGQSLVFDSFAKQVTLNGSDVTDLMFGEWLRLPPGTSTWRLVAGQQSDGFAQIEALPRYT